MLHKKVPVYSILLVGTHFSKKSLYIANNRQVHLLSQKFSAHSNIQAVTLGVKKVPVHSHLLAGTCFIKKSLSIALYSQLHLATQKVPVYSL